LAAPWTSFFFYLSRSIDARNVSSIVCEFSLSFNIVQPGCSWSTFLPLTWYCALHEIFLQTWWWLLHSVSMVKIFTVLTLSTSLLSGCHLWCFLHQLVWCSEGEADCWNFHGTSFAILTSVCIWCPPILPNPKSLNPGKVHSMSQCSRFVETILLRIFNYIFSPNFQLL